MNLTYDEQRTAAQKIEDADLKEAILNGLEVLHERYGDDWVEYINPGTLSMSSANSCILGQVEDHYQYAAGEPGNYPFDRATSWIDGELEENPAAYGFDIGMRIRSYGDLKEAWLSVIGES